MSWTEILGYAAALAVLATFCMSHMIPLRIVALGSNVLFCVYGAAAQIYPVLILHAVLLPINMIRLVQMRRLVRDVRAAQTGPLSIESLVPLRRLRRFAAGATLVRKDDAADRLYYVAEGTLEVPDLRRRLGPGTLVGEIGVFSPYRRRSATVLCVTDCKVYELSEGDAKQLYFQDRSFGFAVLQLMMTRLIEDSRPKLRIVPQTTMADRS